MNPLVERELLDRARTLDPQALAEIYDRYSPPIYAYALRLLGDAATAEDCVAETFSRLLKRLRAGSGPDDYLQAYLYRVAHNWITDQYRRMPPAPLALSDALRDPDALAPEQQHDINARRAQVRAALRCLTPDQRQVVMLKFFENLDNEAVAAVLNRPVGAIKSLQHRALDALRRILWGEGSEQSHGYQQEVRTRADSAA